MVPFYSDTIFEWKLEIKGNRAGGRHKKRAHDWIQAASRLILKYLKKKKS